MFFQRLSDFPSISMPRTTPKRVSKKTKQLKPSAQRCILRCRPRSRPDSEAHTFGLWRPLGLANWRCGFSGMVLRLCEQVVLCCTMLYCTYENYEMSYHRLSIPKNHCVQWRVPADTPLSNCFWKVLLKAGSCEMPRKQSQNKVSHVIKFWVRSTGRHCRKPLMLCWLLRCGLTPQSASILWSWKNFGSMKSILRAMRLTNWSIRSWCKLCHCEQVVPRQPCLTYSEGPRNCMHFLNQQD